MKNKILILGASGMLGSMLFRRLCTDQDSDTYGTVRNDADRAFFPDAADRLITDVDVLNEDSLEVVIQKVKPSLVINCIGVVKQLKEASDPILSISINSLLPHRLAQICDQHNCRLLHISTDCVFDGAKGNYTETDIPTASDLYGRAKFLGEVTDQKHVLTLRTSIIGHELKNKVGLLEWFLAQHDSVRGYTNAIFTGFTTLELSHIIRKYIIPRSDLYGLYHVSSDKISKCSLLKIIADIYHKKNSIEPWDDFICDRSLDSSGFRQLTGYSPPSWESMIHEMYRDYKNQFK